MKQQLYFSALIDRHPTYGADFKKIKEVLARHHIPYGFIDGTKDIWARDYMPVMDGYNELVQCRYEPSYLRADLHLQSNTDEVLINGQRSTTKHFSVKLDGGNYVKRGHKVIMTERVFSENNIKDSGRAEQVRKIFGAPFGANQQQFIDELALFLKLEVCIIPCYPPAEDMTGHSDGYIRFVHNHVVIISQLSEEKKKFADKMRAALKRYNLDFVEMPTFYHQDAAHPNSAIGCYLNYLELDDLIIFPIFDVQPKTDNDAIATIKKHFPHKKVEPIVINDIANDGGLMNCISWTIEKNN